MHRHSLLVGVQRVDDVIGLLEEDGAELFTFCKGGGARGRNDGKISSIVATRGPLVFDMRFVSICAITSVLLPESRRRRRAIKLAAAVGERMFPFGGHDSALAYCITDLLF